MSSPHSANVQIAAAIATAFLVVFVWYLAKKGGESESGRSSMAYIQCREFVKNRLKLPGSADFPYLEYGATEISSKHFVVQSYVDSQNEFGAKIRSNFYCEVLWNGASDSDQRNWNLISLVIN